LDGIHWFGHSEFATGLLAAVVGNDGEVLVEVRDYGEEGLGLAAGAGDHDKEGAGALVPVDEVAAFIFDGGGGEGGWS
jgi:hypothetical protein